MLIRDFVSLRGLLVVAVLAAAFGQQCAQAETAEVFKTVSPDKKYELRETNDAQVKMDVSALYERKSGKLLLDLSEIYGLKGKAENTDTKWNRDSKSFAYHYQFLKSGSTVVYRKEGDAFKELKLPKLPPMKKDDGKEIPDTELNIVVDTVYPIRWEKGGTLVLEEFRIFKDGPWETTYRKIVVSVPEKGEITLKKVESIEDSQKPEELNSK